MMTDYEQIKNLMAKYCFVTDTGGAADIASLFWDDCTVNFGGRINHGIEEAERGFEKWITKMR